MQDQDKLDPVLEKFAQALHAGSTASDALRKAKPKARKWKANAVHVAACNAKADSKVQLRLAQLQAESRARHEVTVDSLTEMLKEDRGQAKELGQPATAVSAVMGMAKLHGLIVDKAQVLNVNVDFDSILRARLMAAKVLLAE